MSVTPLKNSISPEAIASNAAMEQRVHAVEQDLSDIRQSVQRIESGVTTQLSNLQSRFEQGQANIQSDFKQAIASINTKFDERSRTPWAVLIGAGTLFVAVAGYIGALTLKPYERDIQRLDQETVRSDSRQESYRIEMAKFLSDNIVPRREHEEKWRGNDERFAEVNRQIDELKRANGSTYGVRDLLQDLQRRLDRVETSALPQVRQLPPPKGSAHSN